MPSFSSTFSFTCEIYIRAGKKKTRQESAVWLVWFLARRVRPSGRWSARADLGDSCSRVSSYLVIWIDVELDLLASKCSYPAGVQGRMSAVCHGRGALLELGEGGGATHLICISATAAWAWAWVLVLDRWSGLRLVGPSRVVPSRNSGGVIGERRRILYKDSVVVLST